MTDQHRPGKDNGIEDHGLPGLTEQELRDRVAERRGRFLAAARRATRLSAGWDRRNRLVRGWALAAAGFLIICGVFLLARRPGDLPGLVEVAQAGERIRVDGVVISKYDRSPVSGVEIREESPVADGTPGRFITITDPQGSFEINTDEDHETILKCRYNGDDVGQLIVGGDSGIAGYQEIALDVQPEQRRLTGRIDLEPGAKCEPLPGVRVGLDAGAAGPWEGELIHDMEWPVAFTFGVVLAGIYILDGPASDDLSIQVDINPDVVDGYRLEPDELMLISHSQAYRDGERVDPDVYRPEFMGIAVYHQGWYVTDRVEPDVAGRFGLDYISPRITVGDAVRVGWDARPGQQYAIKTPVLGDGSIHAGICYFPEDGRIDRIPGVCLTDSIHPHTWLYELCYRPDRTDTVFVNSGYLKRALPDWALIINWGRNHRLISAAGKDEGDCLDTIYQRYYTYHGHLLADIAYSFIESLVGDGSLKDMFLGQWADVTSEREYLFLFHPMPGDLSCRRYDFTMTDPVEFDIDTSCIRDPVGEYTIAVERRPVGMKTKLSIAGPVGLIDGPVEWDFYADGTVDAYGAEAELLIPNIGAYMVRVTFRERGGVRVILGHEIDFPFDDCLGYYCRNVNQPVFNGVTSPPEVSASHRVLSPFSVASPMAYGTHVSSYLGPWLYIEPPAEWQGVPLSEIRTHFNVRAVNPGAEDMWIATNVIAVNRTSAADSSGGLSRFSPNLDYPDSVEGRIDKSHRKWVPAGVVELYDTGRPGHVKGYIDAETSHNERTIAWYRDKLGIDILNLPPVDKLVARLRTYIEEPYNVMNYAGPEMQPVDNIIQLHDVAHYPGQGYLVGHYCHDGNMPKTGQWEIMSGGADPSRVDLIAADGRVYTVYYDFSALE